jgi:hypothetical protein
MRFFLSLAAGALAFGAATAATVSTDGSCGGATKYTCTGSEFGNCCSQVPILFSRAVQHQTDLSSGAGAALPTATAKLAATRPLAHVPARPLQLSLLVPRLDRLLRPRPPRSSPRMLLAAAPRVTPAPAARSETAAAAAGTVAPPMPTADLGASRLSAPAAAVPSRASRLLPLPLPLVRSFSA